MKVQVTTFTADGATNTTTTVTAKQYAFPKKGNQAANYELQVNGEVKASALAQVATTGGGKYPCYTYFKHDGKSWYLPKECGALPGGSMIEVIAEEPKPVPAKPEAELTAVQTQIAKEEAEAEAAEPVQSKKQRRKAA